MSGLRRMNTHDRWDYDGGWEETEHKNKSWGCHKGIIGGSDISSNERFMTASQYDELKRSTPNRRPASAKGGVSPGSRGPAPFATDDQKYTGEPLHTGRKLIQPSIPVDEDHQVVPTDWNPAETPKPVYAKDQMPAEERRLMEIHAELRERFDFKRPTFKEVYIILDLDKDGRLSITELKQGLPLHLSTTFDEKDYGILFNKLDPENTGYVSFQRMTNFLKRDDEKEGDKDDGADIDRRTTADITDIRLHNEIVSRISLKRRLPQDAFRTFFTLNNDGNMTKDEFRHGIKVYFDMNLSDDEFERQVTKYMGSDSTLSRSQKNAISYPMFLHFMQVVEEAPAGEESPEKQRRSRKAAPENAPHSSVDLLHHSGEGMSTGERFQKRAYTVVGENADDAPVDPAEAEKKYQSWRAQVIRDLDQVSVSLTDTWKKFAAPYGNHVGPNEFADALKRLTKQHVDLIDSRKLFNEADTRQNGEISMNDLAALLGETSLRTAEEALVESASVGTAQKSHLMSSTMSVPEADDVASRRQYERSATAKLDRITHRLKEELMGRSHEILSICRARLDHGRTGKLSLQEFRRMLQVANVFLNEVESDLFFRSMDVNKKGEMDYVELANMFAKDKTPVKTSQIDAEEQERRSLRYQANSMSSSVIL